MKKEILLTILATFIIGGCIYGATFKDVSPQKTEKQEKDIDGVIQMVDVNVDTPDLEKTIEKAWTEEMTSSFTPQLLISELENTKAEIDGQIINYNKRVDEFTEAVTALKLTIEIPVKY